MTKQEAIAAHRKMWNWLADETERRGMPVEQDDYFIEEMGLSPITTAASKVDHLSFCCQHAKERDADAHDFTKRKCDYCPILWGTEGSEVGYFCECEKGGLYSQWMEAVVNWKRVMLPGTSDGVEWVRKAAEIARQIAELPEKEDVKDAID